MDTFQQIINNVTGGDFIGKVIAAIIIVVLVAALSHLVVKWLRHIMRRDDNAIPQSSIFVNITRGIIWGLGICLILDSCFNVNMSALIAALGVGGIALSLGFSGHAFKFDWRRADFFYEDCPARRQHPGGNQ